MTVTIRRATMADAADISKLIAESARGLGRSDYSDGVIEAALQSVWGLDTQLLDDSTYFLHTRGRRVGCLRRLEFQKHAVWVRQPGISRCHASLSGSGRRAHSSILCEATICTERTRRASARLLRGGGEEGRLSHGLAGCDRAWQAALPRLWIRRGGALSLRHWQWVDHARCSHVEGVAVKRAPQDGRHVPAGLLVPQQRIRVGARRAERRPVAGE